MDARVKGMLLVPLVLAPSVMVAVSAAERRCGPAVAGWLVAAPITLAIALITLGPARGPVAESAAAHVPAQVAFALAFAALLRRGAFVGFAAGVAAYAATAIALPEWAGLAIALPLLALAARRPRRLRPSGVHGRGPEFDQRQRQPRELAVRALVAAVFVCAVCAAMGLAGPQVAGAIAAFPAMSGSLALLIHRADGPRAAAHALQGLVHGLAGYFAFAVTVAVLAPSPLAVAAGLVACGVTGRVTWRAVRPAGGGALAAA